MTLFAHKGRCPRCGNDPQGDAEFRAALASQAAGQPANCDNRNMNERVAYAIAAIEKGRPDWALTVLKAAGPSLTEVREWPKSRDVGRLEDMSPDGHLRVGLDGDSDVYLSIYAGGEDPACASVEFCVPGTGGGKSGRTRQALIALMVAMECDNAEDPSRDWWALRGVKEAPL